jgi:hypothetical protein
MVTLKEYRINQAGNKVVRLLYEQMCKLLVEFHKGTMKNPLKVGYTYEDEDKHYQIYCIMERHKKHTCKECVYNLDPKCYFRDYTLSLNKKRYCDMYQTDKPCWDCKNWDNYGTDESWCDIDMKRDLKYSYDYNKNNECPNWELDK